MDVAWFQRVLAAVADQGCPVDLVLLVNPTYQGLSAPLAPLVRLCHSRGLPVLVDEAHGSHFRGHAALPRDALAAGADLVCIPPINPCRGSPKRLFSTVAVPASPGRIWSRACC